MKKYFSFIVSLSLFFIFCLPTKAFDKVKFINFSDLHLSINGENTMKMGKESVDIVKSCVDLANKTNDISFVILTGDLLQDAEPWNLDKVKEILDNLNVPYYVILGNHDISPVQTDTNKFIFPSISKSTFVWAFQGHGFNGSDSWWSVDPVQGLHLIGLDTTVTGTWGGNISKKQLEWLDKDLEKNKDKLCIVLSHHALVPHTKDDFNRTKNFVVENSNEVRKILEKHKVKIVITGHHHITDVKTINGITYFSNPSTTTYPTKYTIYELTNNELKYSTEWVKIDEKIIEQAKINLLKDDWWRGFFPKNKKGDEDMLKQFLGEEETDRQGIIKLN